MVKSNFETLELNKNNLNNDYISLIIKCRELNQNKGTLALWRYKPDALFYLHLSNYSTLLDIESVFDRRTINGINSIFNSTFNTDKLSPVFN